MIIYFFIETIQIDSYMLKQNREIKFLFDNKKNVQNSTATSGYEKTTIKNIN